MEKTYIQRDNEKLKALKEEVQNPFEYALKRISRSMTRT